MQKRPVKVTFVAAEILVMGILNLISGLLLFISANSLAEEFLSPVAGEVPEKFQQLTMRTFVALGAGALVMGIITILVGAYLLRGANWARWACAIMSVMFISNGVQGFLNWFLTKSVESSILVPILFLGLGAINLYILIIDKESVAFFKEK